MNATAFDTLKFTEELTDAGVPKKQAKAQTNLMAKVMGDLTTKQDLKNVKTELKAEMTKLRAEMTELRAESGSVKTELKAEMTELRAEIGSVKTELGAKIDRKANYLVLSIIGIILGVKLFEFIF